MDMDPKNATTCIITCIALETFRVSYLKLDFLNNKDSAVPRISSKKKQRPIGHSHR